MQGWRGTGIGVLVGAILAGAALAPPPADAVMSVPQFRALPRQPADQRIAYGTDPMQFGDLRIPSTPGPHPVAVLIHGGCWKAEYADLDDMGPIADALKAEGIATWNIEYRRMPQSGSGWPGTYTDVGNAIDHLRSLAGTHALDLDRVVVVGHSVGGSLALWAAARPRLPEGSALHVRDPLALRGVVDLAGPGDLSAELRAEENACGERVIEPLLGGDPAAVPDRYAQTSAVSMLPLRVPQVLVWGTRDDIAPLWLATDYRRDARRAGDPVRLVLVPGLGHFDIASPASPAWPHVRVAIERLLGTPAASR
jgi:acetyl esterase/lipase